MHAAHGDLVGNRRLECSSRSASVCLGSARVTLLVTFKVPGTQHDAAGQLALDQLAETLVQLNVDYLRTHPNTPTLAQSGVYYDLGADVQQPWLTIPEILAAGRGDCEDLAGWRAAERRIEGIEAKMCPQGWLRTWQSGAGRWGIHWKVCLPDGTVEDPSAELARWAQPVGKEPGDKIWLTAAVLGTLVAAPLAWMLGRNMR